MTTIEKAILAEYYEEPKNVLVYVLFSSRDPKHARYVGQTKRTACCRFNDHKARADRGELLPVHQWIRDEIKAGYRIGVREIVYDLTRSEATELENKLIGSLPGLTNVQGNPGEYSLTMPTT